MRWLTTPTRVGARATAAAVLALLAAVAASGCVPAAAPTPTWVPAPAPTSTAAPVTLSRPTPPPSAPTSPTSAPTPAATSSGQGEVIEGAEHFWNPSSVTVPVGTRVTWLIVGQQQHDVQAEDGSFASSLMGPGQSFSYTFTRPGRYDFYCNPHRGDGMVGVVIVQ